MEIIRHPGFLEIRLPEFLGLDPRIDNIARIFTSVQPGTHNLLIDLSGARKKAPARSESQIRHFSRALVVALESLTEEVELIAFVADTSSQDDLKPYVGHLEEAGFDVRLFSDRHRAVGWLGR